MPTLARQLGRYLRWRTASLDIGDQYLTASLMVKDVYVLSATLFIFGKFLIGLYIGQSGVISGSGAAGSLLLLWVYYSAQSFLIGAESRRVLPTN